MNFSSLKTALILGSVFAAPSAWADIKDLEARVDRLDAKAVEGTTKKIIAYGHVNRALNWAHNGVNSNLAHVDNDNYSSRLGFKGSVSLSDDLQIVNEILVEYEPNTNFSNDVGQAQDTISAGNRIRIRKTEVYAKSKTYGKLSVGHGNMASKNVLYDTEFTGSAVFMHPSTVIAGVKFVNRATDMKFDLAGGEVFEHGDGVSSGARHGRVRYDTPKFFNMLSLSASHGYKNTGDLVDVAFRFGGSFSNYKVAVQGAWGRNRNGTGLAANGPYDTYMLSAGLLVPCSFSGKDDTGLHFYAGGSIRDWSLPGQRNGHTWQGKIGFKDHFFPCGLTSIVFNYGRWSSMYLDPVDLNAQLVGKTGGVGIVQFIDKAGTELYVNYSHFKAERERTTDRFYGVNVILAGARVTF